ncbi:MAG TPA: DUF2269 family protein [Gaiellaceae bacterium]|nr:DUF2269 family protein [Gaiellaceae bacterium]
MTTAQWLLMFHITGAFLLVSGSVAAGVLNILSVRAQRPSETALYLRLIRSVVPVIGLGSIATLVFGLWLVHQLDFSFWSFWIIAALVLWLISGALGGAGGKHQERARAKAEQLAAAGDASDDELRALLRDRRGQAMSWLAGLATLLLLVDMVWKPGS